MTETNQLLPCKKQILQNIVTQGKKLGKAVYVFSVHAEGGKVAHANYVPEDVRAKGFDARTWASKVTEVLGGKVRPPKCRVIGKVDKISL
jgi:alanyl-tRNA synthetase